MLKTGQMVFQPFEGQLIGSRKIECRQLVNVDPGKRGPGTGRRSRHELAEKERKLHTTMIVTMINPCQQLLRSDSEPGLFETFPDSTIRGAFLLQAFSTRKLMFAPQDCLRITDSDKKGLVALNEGNPDPGDRFWRDSGVHELVVVFRHRGFPVPCHLPMVVAGSVFLWPRPCSISVYEENRGCSNGQASKIRKAGRQTMVSSWNGSPSRFPNATTNRAASAPLITR